jgi:hypothetical protein
MSGIDFKDLHDYRHTKYHDQECQYNVSQHNSILYVTDQFPGAGNDLVKGHDGIEYELTDRQR